MRRGNLVAVVATAVVAATALAIPFARPSWFVSYGRLLPGSTWRRLEEILLPLYACTVAIAVIRFLARRRRTTKQP